MAKRWEGVLGCARVAAILVIASAYMPARVYASNLDKFPHFERVAVLVGVLWVLSLSFYFGILRLTRQPSAALGAAAVLAILFGSGGNVAARVSTLAACLLMLSVAVAFGVLLARFSAETQRSLVLVILALALSGPAAGFLTANRIDDGIEAVEPVTTTLPERLAERPDIYVIVLDAFPGDRALSEFYAQSIQWTSIPGVTRLDAWANYPVTLASVASLFQMGLPLEAESILDGGTRSTLAEIISGENRFVRTLSAQGYRTSVVESGWSRSYCHESIDVCVPSHFVDEGVFEILHQSVFGDFVAHQVGSGLTAGAQSTMNWLQARLPVLAANDQSDFVFASVLLPHPPLMLNDDCELDYDHWKSGNSLFAGDGLTHQRTMAFLDQTQCAAKFETDLLRVVPDNALVVFISDHGGDSAGQLSSIGRSWSTTDILERMNVHLSIRTPVPCALSQPSFVSEVLRQLLFCLSDQRVPEVANPTVYLAERIAEPKILKLVRLDLETLQRLEIVPSSGRGSANRTVEIP